MVSHVDQTKRCENYIATKQCTTILARESCFLYGPFRTRVSERKCARETKMFQMDCVVSCLYTTSANRSLNAHAKQKCFKWAVWFLAYTRPAPTEVLQWWGVARLAALTTRYDARAHRWLGNVSWHHTYLGGWTRLDTHTHSYIGSAWKYPLTSYLFFVGRRVLWSATAV